MKILFQGYIKYKSQFITYLSMIFAISDFIKIYTVDKTINIIFLFALLRTSNK